MIKSKRGSVCVGWKFVSVLMALVVGMFTAPQGACYQRAGIAPVKAPNISGRAQGDTGMMVVDIPYSSGYVESYITYSLNDGASCPSLPNKYQTTGSAGVIYNYVTLAGKKYAIEWRFLSYSETPLGGVSDYTDYFTASQHGYSQCTDFSGTGMTGQNYTTPQIHGVVSNLPSDLPPGSYNITGHGYFGVYTSAMTGNYPYPNMVNTLLKNGWNTLNRVDFTVPVTYAARCWYSGNLDYDYNTITMDKVSDARLENNLVINCNAATNAHIAIQPAKPPSGSYGGTETALGMGNHLDALIDFDGIKSGSSVSLQSGNNIFKVSSTLKNINGYPVEGSYQGGGTVLITLL